MEVEERNVSSGYAKPPWIFKGRQVTSFTWVAFQKCLFVAFNLASFFAFSALYQIHLVKASTARAFIPKEFRLVEAFGYTLGGFFLASYDDSPAGVFDELVMIAGIVWNPPTSCAYVHSSPSSNHSLVKQNLTQVIGNILWAARVLVNSNEACHHGRKKITAVPKRKRERAFGFLDTFGLGTTLSHPEDLMEVKVSEVDSAASANICNIQIRSNESETKLGKWMGPAIKMSLPSFRVRPVSPAVVSKPLEDEADKNHTSQESLENERRLSVAVMLSKPIIALQFKDLTMQVEAPVVVHPSV
ncbi:hypothetical protein DY000_02023259 [Brassica cretica]|uniref:Protein NEOXANTHIN-DEFICIENT 1 n=1 Tax=Brassica cretica TaxID=69181 RepID=A0ABQ7EMN6_BRACR|nr:hypothetical protein DY000_02023259 [Brassica cretica]